MHFWGIEEGILLEKHYGYGYSTAFLTTGRDRCSTSERERSGIQTRQLENHRNAT